MSTGFVAGVVNLDGWRSVTNVWSGPVILAIAAWINGSKPVDSSLMAWLDVVRGNGVRASTSIPLADGSATRWSGCWKRTTIGGSPGRTVLSPRAVANDRFRPSLVGLVNVQCRLLRPHRRTTGLRTTCFRSSAGSGNRLSGLLQNVLLQSGLLQKGSRWISRLPQEGACPARVVEEPDIAPLRRQAWRQFNRRL